MAGHVGVVGEEDHPLAVGGNVGKPVVVIVGENLLLLAAVGLHAPDLHVTGALGVEVDIFSVRGVFGTVVLALCRGKAGFFTSCRGNGVDVDFAFAFTDEGERLSVGRPSVPVGRRLLGEASRCSAGDGDDVNEGFVILLRIVADGKLRAVGGNAVIVVAACGQAGVENFRLTAVYGKALDAAVAIDEECAAVASPVGSFEASLSKVGDTAVGGIDGDGFECAVQDRLTCRSR